jgi:hypothetical protein
MKYGQDLRIIEADSFFNDAPGGWIIFNRDGQEYWRARLDSVVSMETIKDNQ